MLIFLQQLAGPEGLLVYVTYLVGKEMLLPSNTNALVLDDTITRFVTTLDTAITQVVSDRF
jgi:hypothetical protein